MTRETSENPQALATATAVSGSGKSRRPTWKPYRPSHMDDVYLEMVVDRPDTAVLGLPFVLLGLLILVVSTVYGMWPMVMLGGACFVIGVGIVYNGASKPCREVVRFNRVRRKVYVSHVKRDGAEGSGRWVGDVSVFLWDGMDAQEHCDHALKSRYVSVDGVRVDGVLMQDSFRLSHNSGQEGTARWSLVRAYMEDGPVDWLKATGTQPPSTPLIAGRWAPKVAWPAALDVESTTVPD